MGNDIIPSWKHAGCGGAVYLDGEHFFCKRCAKKLSVLMDEASRKVLRGTRFAGTKPSDRASKTTNAEYLAQILFAIGEFILTLMSV